MKRFIIVLAAAVLFAPSFALASFTDSVEIGRQRVDALTQQQLDSTNVKLFSDAFMTAKIIGYDRSEIDELKAEVAALKVQCQGGAEQAPAGLEARVSRLEGMFAGLQDSLVLLLNMLSEVLTKLR